MGWNLRRTNRPVLDWTRPFSWGVIPFEFNQARKWFHQLWPLLTTAGVLLLWVTSLPNIDLRQMTDLGLVSVLPPRFFMAFSLLILSFSFLVNQQPARSWVLLLHIIVLVLMVHGTPPAVYETLRYSWAWKHVGIVDYIQRYGSVNPTDTYFDAYHNWPGFFALSALITEIAGFESAVSFANWAPVFFNLLSLGALLLIMKALTQDQRLVWLSVWFFFLANWVGQDYFSPQALSYFLYLVTLGICLGWFRITTPSTNHGIPILTRLKRVAPLLGKYLSPVASSDVANRQSQPLERVGLLLIAILLMGVITFTHQLTPFMTIGSLTALVVFRRLSPRGLPLLMTILTTTWISYMAAAFLNDTVETVAETIARLLSNADATLIDISIVSPGQALVALMGRGLTVFIGGLAFLGGIRRLCCGYRDLTAILLVISPVAPLAFSSYEGEMAFRVYLFSLPFLAFFAAALLYPHWTSGASAKTAFIAISLSSIMLGGFFFAYYGKERQYHFTQGEFEAAQFLYNTAPPGSLLIEGTPNYPSRFKNYEIFSYVAISREAMADRIHLIGSPVETLSRWMSNDAYSATYFIITRSQKAEVDALGEMPPGSLDKIEQALKQSPEFKVIFFNEDASIFVLSDHQGEEL